jgi:hypothetical protein
MELLKVVEVVFTFQSELGELREAQRARLCLPLGERVGVGQAGQVAQHGGAGVDVGVSH